MVEIKVPPGVEISAEPGTMVHKQRLLHPSVDMGGCGQGCKRCCCAGESCCRLNFLNTSPDQAQLLALAARTPAKIIPLHLASFPRGVFFRKRAFLAAFGKDWLIHLKLAGCCTGCCGGQGFVLNKLTGSSWAFLAAGGTVMKKQLNEGESIIVDQFSVLAFEDSVKFGVVWSGNCAVICCGGMGAMNARLTGPGMVLIESMNPTKLVLGLRGG